MPTLLVTGASRGIGREIVDQYTAAGWRVIAACRDPEAADLDCEMLALDVGDGAAIDALPGRLDGVAIDLLWNNAGVYPDKGVALEDLDYDAWSHCMTVNVLAPIRLASALAGNVAASEGKVMAFTSSTMGSIARNSGGAYVYRSSKAALNMAVTSLVQDMRPKGIACCLLHPGWVRTDMGGPRATVDVEESASGLMARFDALSLETTGVFEDHRGAAIPF